ncbi:MAG TPA: SUMF1/EgtB/PvdO family nonheme iron enzyme [Kofleriaceae bacterium]|jgi:serine/threonine protein kinase/formylglycine-generating enzyme required for sulfatase activity|nr:SUMF1/EgtB/PvdO family nonheme iron enzyme [Kofleriaceae bacterium]
MTLVTSSGAGAMLGPPWRPPDEFDEFRLVRSLGDGAMGQVYLAHDTLLDRQVAVKFVHAAADPAARTGVLDEARAIARLQHPNVVAIYRVAEVAGHPYLVSEYVQGKTLHELPRPMPWRMALDIAIDLARGLAAAHRRGVLHRDVKPANAILTDDGRAKLLDFGLATIVDRRPADEVILPRAEPMARHPDSVPIDLAALMADPTQSLTGVAASPPAADVAAPVRQVVGTPIYMAPEVWRGEPATRRSDLYSLGILLYELLVGTAPFRDVDLHQLSSVVQHRAIPRLGDVAPEVEPALAAIVDRLVERDPRARFASADALLVALEDSAAPPAAGTPEGNPYRGLAAFESAHAAVFFGRRIEVRELVDRVRLEPFVVVGGDSGTGKSSLCRAGVLPWLAEHGGWQCVEVIPGLHPVRSLAAALAPWTGSDEAALADQLCDDPDAVARMIRRHAGTGDGSPRRLLVFVDQLEELATLSTPREARHVAAAIAALAVRSPSVRVLATARSDFLSRLAMLPGLGDEMARGLYFLRPLGGDQIREAIARPAAARGVVYESEALIEQLVAHTEDAPGGLPLLQFTLAELWDARDVSGRAIRAEALDALGGVAGALARHADRLLAGLRADERDAARRILLRLITGQGTRTRRTKAELLSEGGARAAELTALEALIRGRAVVASNAQDGAYEIAHEALLTGWSTLQGWLTRDAADHAVRERLAQAAAEWDRVGARDLLWGRRQLAETHALDRASLAPREAVFLAASTRAIRTRRMTAMAGAAALAICAVVVGLAVRARARREVEAMIADQVSTAMSDQALARQIAAQRDLARGRALALFDGQHWSEGEQAWREVEAIESREERTYRRASEAIDSVLLLDPTRASLRAWAADLASERLARAERDRRRDLADELASRLLAYGDHRYASVRGGTGRIALTVAPPDAQVWIEAPGVARRRADPPLSAIELPAGSLVLAFEAPGRVPGRLPVLLARGETLAVEVALPPASPALAGMVYVPRGRFLFGSAESSEALRQVFNAAPLHEVTTAGYLIARHEVTFADWIEFLDALDPDQRRLRIPRSNNAVSSITLTEVAPRRWRLSLTPTTRTYTAEAGQRLHYEGRARRADQDWLRFPVSAVSFEDAVAFAGWLDRTHRLPGARLCDEYEWERAARGADGRLFPGGDEIAPEDADIDVTYGRQPLAFGPDEVGSHPGSRSPVGADDMAGNVWEWTRSVQTTGAPVVRGGSWYHGRLSARSLNREYGEPTERTPLIGVRLCATPP